MIQKRLTADQRSRVAEKIMELGNLTFVGSVVSQFLAGEPFRGDLAAAGIIGLLMPYALAWWLMKGGVKK